MNRVCGSGPVPSNPALDQTGFAGWSAPRTLCRPRVTVLIRLVGPGGAGKTTTGALLAERLGVAFIDLDERFMSTVDHIGEFIDSRGYLAYAARNVDLYTTLLEAILEPTVLALSSGFMTYPPDVNDSSGAHREAIAASPSTFVLLPSVDLETCVAEIVRRQLTRPFAIGQSAAHEEHVIRTRFGTYSAIPAPKVETIRAPGSVVDEIVRSLCSSPEAPR